MALPNIYRQNNKGFTLIEILVVMAILAAIIGFGLLISFDAYKSYSFSAEKNNLITILQKARNQSLDNINQTRHGVHFQASPLTYVLFECPSTNPQCTAYAPSSKDVTIDVSYAVSITDPVPLPFDIVFDQLNGNCVTSNCTTKPLNITLSSAGKFHTISINSEGRIDW